MPERQPLPDHISYSRPVARKTDPHTSHEAAERIRETDSERVRRLIWTFLRNIGPMTDEEIEAEYRRTMTIFDPHSSPSGLRTRRKELTDRTEGERVIDSGQRKPNSRGRKAILWMAVQ